MKTKFSLFIMAALIVGLFITGCGQDNKLVGKWSAVKNGDTFKKGDIISVEKNNDSYIVVIENQKFPASYNKGVLQCQISMATVKMYVDEKSGHLMFNATTAWKIFNDEFEKKS